MNLVEMNLVPLKTKAKTKNKETLLFIKKEYSREIGTAYVFMTTSSLSAIKIIAYNQNGAAQGAPDMDIVSVSKPWRPKEGDLVTVCGLAISTSSDRPFFFNVGHENTSVCRIVAPSLNRGGNGFWVIEYDMSQYIVHESSMRRHVGD